jgi:hypothetical protein
MLAVPGSKEHRGDMMPRPRVASNQISEWRDRAMAQERDRSALG